MSEYAITVSSQTYELIQQLAQRTQQTIEQVVSDLALQPTKHIVPSPKLEAQFSHFILGKTIHHLGNNLPEESTELTNRLL